jgi:hypothetical protein
MQPDNTIPTVSIPGSGDLGSLVVHYVYQIPHIFPWLLATGKTIVEWLVVLSFPIALFFIIGIIYTVEQMKVIKKKYAEKHDVKIEPAFEDVAVASGSRDLTERWRKAQTLLNSQNQNDWKQAILEADTMLLDILTGLGYQGDGVGEKLKRVLPGEMQSLDDAWEAHKIRNTIAHEAGFQLDHHMATQTMHRFRKVFEEFYYI